jgi:membrane protein insertase Oxa1/YidC/SpoIIIJ
LAAASGFVQMHFSTQNTSSNSNSSSGTPDLSQMMAKQMKFTLPVVIFLVSWQISGVVALYWFTSNVVSMIQDYIVKKQYKTSLQKA